jgi:hypothetical protein
MVTVTFSHHAALEARFGDEESLEDETTLEAGTAVEVGTVLEDELAGAAAGITPAAVARTRAAILSTI